jgi:type 1 glutamine amidotransferase/HEAT repeat protein
MKTDKAISRICRIAAFAVIAAAFIAAGTPTGCTAATNDLRDLSAWREPTGDWFVAGDAMSNPKDEKLLAAKRGTGVMINGTKGSTGNILTAAEYGDVELHIEFMVPKGSNSGVYLQGRYEIQVFDSWGVAEPHYSDCGGIYQRWKNDRGYEGRAPMVNASKSPGQWQSFDAIFRSPKFNASGQKIANARFVKVLHNGVLVHESVEVTGPTRASTYEDEKPTGPVMLQGDHGPVAYRNIRITPIAPEAAHQGMIKALIVDGQNNHSWQTTTPVLKELLEETEMFVVDVATSPAKGQPMEGFKPDFSKYDVVVINYTGDDWSKETQDSLVRYMAGGGGLVIYHAADNAFARWKEFNEMIALGGWGGRNEKSGPMVRYRDGQMAPDYSPGGGGSHGPQHDFQIVMRNSDHPITAGLPEKWMHVKDELYSTLRGPAKNMTLLATAYADPAMQGTGENEPMFFTISYGQGRVFHTALGHAPEQLQCAGFITTFLRGTEWSATGQVTQTEVPADFPTADAVSIRTTTNAKLPEGYGKEIVTWDFGKDRQALAAIEEDIRTAGSRRMAQIEAVLVGVLDNPKTTVAGRQFVCRLLRRMGTVKSVPALAAMLSDKELSHMARFALQYMAAPEAGQALRDALDKVDGDLTTGIVGSLGLRGDRDAIAKIIPLMQSSDRMTAQAAIKALGHIGGREAAMALSQAKVADDLKTLKDDALLMCADGALARGMTDIAASVYERMAGPENSTFIRIAAHRGLVQAKKEEAVGTIIALLNDNNVDLQGAAGKFIVEMPGEAATRAFAGQLESLPAASKIILIGALENRGDSAAAGAIAKVAASNSDETVRIAALQALATLGNASVVPLLADMSVEQGAVGSEAIATLTRVKGEGVGKALIDMIGGGRTSTIRANIIDVVVARRNTDAVGALLKAAAYKALGSLAGRDEFAQVVAMLTGTNDASDRGQIERAINSIAGRLEAQDAGVVIKALSRADDDAKARLAGVLARLGGNDALGAVRRLFRDSSTDVRKAAVRAMAEWPSPEPLDDLIKAAKAESDVSMHVIALRGYIKLVSQPANRAASETVKLLAAAIETARRADEKKAVLAVLPDYACSEAAVLVEQCSKDSALQQEAKLAAGKIKQSMINKKLSATASPGNDDAKNALDGNKNTRWSTGRSMKPGDWFILDLGVEDTVKKVTLDTTGSANDFPVGYEVYVSFDGGNWGKPLLVGKGTKPITVLEFDKPVKTRYIRIVQTGSSDSWHWSIHTLNVEFE